VSERVSGTATFVFTDVEGSTRLLKQLRERYGDVLAQHQKIVRKAFAAYGGSEIDTQGDSFFTVFPSARGAVLAAVTAQRALEAHEWPEGTRVRVRIGIHTGEAIREGGRYVGLSVHRAARICAATHGGQILVSQTTVNVLEDEEDELRGFGLRDLGNRQLKDLERPVRLYQVEADGLIREFPPPPAESVVARFARSRRAQVVLALVTVAAVAGIGVATVSALRGPDATLAPPRSLAYVDPATNELAGSISLTASPTAVVFCAGAVWVALPEEQTLLRIDPETRQIERRIGLGITPDALAADEDVWIAAIGGRRTIVARLSPNLNTIVERFTVPSHAFARLSEISLAVSEPLVWIGHQEQSQVYRIDADTDRVRRIPGLQVEGLAARPDVVWAVERQDEAIARLDPGTGEVEKSIPFGAPRPIHSAETLRSDAEADERGVWVSDSLDGKVWRLDARTDQLVGSTSVGRGARDLATGAGGVWVSSPLDGRVVRLDAKSGEQVASVDVGTSVAGLAVGDGRVWVAVP
jgi:class 3 adenylate cyclase/streptogramin lyase